MKKAIKDVKIGDKVLGTDGKWHKVIDKTEMKLATKMYEITFSNGKVKCADVHLWNVFVNDKMYTIDTMAIEQEFEFYKNRAVGIIDGPCILSIKEIPPEYVQCITTDAKDNQFMIYGSRL